MSGQVVRRCAACRKPVLLADRGSLHTIDTTRIVSIDPEGDATVLCPCGQTFVWQRERAMQSTQAGGMT